MSQDKASSKISLGIAITLFAYLFFSVASSLVWTFQGKFPTIQIIFLQNAIAFFTILPLSLRKGWNYLKTNELHIHLIRDLFGLTSYFLFFLAIRFLNLVDATILNYASPFFVPFVWWLWMKEKIDPHIWWVIIFGFIGVALILSPGSEIFDLGFIFGIFAAITAAIALVSIRILNVRKEPMRRTLFYFFSISSLLSFPFAWASWTAPSPTEWGLCFLIGLATAIGQVLLTIAYRHGTASYLSPLGYSVVLYNMLISYYFFEAPLNQKSLLGATLIIVSGTATYVFKRKPKTVKQTFQVPNPKDKPPM